MSRKFSFLPGPIFANLILADEINRTPPKTQAALLEAMEENTVTSLGRRFELVPPFFVLATQNPVEQEGTYPLPIAQLDRFMFNILFDYPTQEEEYRIVRLTVPKVMTALQPLLSHQEIYKYIRISQKIQIPLDVMQYATTLCRMSRPNNPETSQLINESLAWGASPRAAQCLILGAKTRAMLQGRHFVTPQDIRAIIHPIFRHRIILNYKAEADGITPDEIIDDLLTHVSAPDGVFSVATRRTHSQKLYLAVLNR